MKQLKDEKRKPKGPKSQEVIAREVIFSLKILESNRSYTRKE